MKTNIIKSQKVISKPGAAIEVTSFELTEEGKKALCIGNAKIPSLKKIEKPINTREIFTFIFGSVFICFIGLLTMLILN